MAATIRPAFPGSHTSFNPDDPKYKCSFLLKDIPDFVQKLYPEIYRRIQKIHNDGFWQEFLSLKTENQNKLSRELEMYLSDTPVHSFGRLIDQGADVNGLGLIKGSSNKTPTDLLVFESDFGIYGVVKPRSGATAAQLESEIAAYRISKLLSFDIVPLTSKRVVDRKEGSLQLYTAGMKTAKNFTGEVNAIDYKKMSIFDFLIGNKDRHHENYLVSTEGRIVAIDHGLSLRNSSDFLYDSERVTTYRINPDFSFFESADGDKVIARLRSVRFEELEAELKELLSEKEILALEKRIVRVLEYAKRHATLVRE